jgi:hypothetical protein
MFTDKNRWLRSKNKKQQLSISLLISLIIQNVILPATTTTIDGFFHVVRFDVYF